MDTDDDIFLIHKRTEAYISNLHILSEQWKQKRQQLLLTLLSSKPPHGFTMEDWADIAATNGIDLQALQALLNDGAGGATGGTNGGGRARRGGGSPKGSPKRSPKLGPKRVRLSFKECKEMLQQIEYIEHFDDLSAQDVMYECRSKDIIDRYKKCITNVVYADFMAPVKHKDISPEQRMLRDELIYLIESIFGIDAVEKVVTRKQNSMVSRSLLSDEYGYADRNTDGLTSCTTSSDATAEMEMEESEEDWNSMVYNDINRINFNIKFKYDKRLHFKETINQYQGLQHKNIPQEVFNDLLDMIDKHGLCDHSKEDPRDKYAKLRKEHITMFLSESNHSIYYEDKQLIYSRITGHPCPNIQRYEKGLYSDFEQLVEVFLQLPESKVDRKNFLNTHYVLRQLLRKRGVIVPEHDLNIIKTPARIRAHDDIYQMCCERLGWNFEPLG